MNISNLDSCCKNESGFCEWVSCEQKPLFFLKFISISLWSTLNCNDQNRKKQSIIINNLCTPIHLSWWWTKLLNMRYYAFDICLEDFNIFLCNNNDYPPLVSIILPNENVTGKTIIFLNNFLHPLIHFPWSSVGSKHVSFCPHRC